MVPTGSITIPGRALVGPACITCPGPTRSSYEGEWGPEVGLFALPSGCGPLMHTPPSHMDKKWVGVETYARQAKLNTSLPPFTWRFEGRTLETPTVKETGV